MEGVFVGGGGPLKREARPDKGFGLPSQARRKCFKLFFILFLKSNFKSTLSNRHSYILNLQSQKLETLSYPHLNQGTIEVITDLHSNFIEDRILEVWLPPNFDSENNYDLLIMHDGQNLFDGTKTWNKQEWKLDEWASKLIPEKSLLAF